MNLVGKIFVFLIFCMSLVFMAFSVMVYATHINWKDEVLRTDVKAGQQLGWKKRLENEQLEKEKVETQKADLEDQLETERALRRQLISKLEAEKLALEAQAQSARQELAVLVDAHKVALTSVETAQKRIGVLMADSGALRSDINIALDEIDKRYNEYLVALEQAHQAQGEVQRNAQRQQQLIEELTKAKDVLDKNDLKIDTPTGDAPPKIDGFVIRVAEANDQLFVEVSVGSDDGLLQGHEMEIFRGGTWLGRATIVRTTPDRAVGKVNRSTQKGEIHERDRVETKRSLQKT
jgi:hypothetical protein